MKEVNTQTVQRAKNRGVEILRYEEVEELGAGKSHAEVVCWNYFSLVRHWAGKQFIATAHGGEFERRIFST